MTAEERQLTHDADVQRVTAIIATLPPGAQQLIARYRAIVERAGRMSPAGNAWNGYAHFVVDVQAAFAGTPEKKAGVETRGLGV